MNQFYLLLFACLSTMLQSMDQTPPAPISTPKQVERKHSGDSKSQAKPIVPLGSKNSAFHSLTIQIPRLPISTIIPSGLGAKKMRRSDSVLTQAPDSPRQDSGDENSNTQSAQPKMPRICAIADRSRSTSPDPTSEEI